MGSGEVAIVALSTMISLKVTFSDGLGEGRGMKQPISSAHRKYVRFFDALRQKNCNFVFLTPN